MGCASLPFVVKFSLVPEPIDEPVIRTLSAAFRDDK